MARKIIERIVLHPVTVKRMMAFGLRLRYAPAPLWLRLLGRKRAVLESDAGAIALITARPTHFDLEVRKILNSLIPEYPDHEDNSRPKPGRVPNRRRPA